MADHDTRAIAESQAFKAINLLLDQHAEELRGVLLSFKSRVTQVIAAPEPGSSPWIETRVSYELPRRLAERPHVELPFNPVLLKELRWYLDETERLERSINELQRYKLRLLNDWDFTHGNNTEQTILFGEPPADDLVERVAMHLYCFGYYHVQGRVLTPDDEAQWNACLDEVKHNYRRSARPIAATIPKSPIGEA